MAVANSIPDEAAELADQFPDDVDVDEAEIAERISMLVDEYRVPRDEAVLTTRNYFLDAYGLEYDDLDGQGGASGSADEREIATIEGPNEWLSVTAKVVQLWENDVDSIAQVGLIGDETGTIKVTVWESADAPTIEDDGVYHFENVVSDEYEGRLSVQVNSASDIIPVDDEDADDLEVGSTDAETAGALVAVQPGSGLIKRCPNEDCTRVLQNGRCSEHGEVDGEFDLRVKAVIDDGQMAYDILFNEEATEGLTGISLEEAKQMAMDALDTSVVADAIEDEVLGHSYTVSGPIIGNYLVVNDCEKGNSLSEDAVSPGSASNGDREVAKRVFAEEFNSATSTFTESDEDRAPVYALLPSGEKANRVFVVGTLTETTDVGSDSEYWQARIVGPTGTFFAYAGQYQPEVASVLRNAEPPAYVAVIGKPRTYETDDGDVNVSIRPESISIVGSEARDAWVAEAAEQTLARLEAFDPDDPAEDDDERNYDAMAVDKYDPDLNAYEAMVNNARDDLEAGELSEEES
jgi:RPA family protein